MLGMLLTGALMVAGQPLSGDAAKGYLDVRYGRNGMLARPALMSASTLRTLVDDVWPKQGYGGGQRFTSSADPRLWALFSARYGFVQDDSENGLPYGLTREVENGQEAFFFNCLSCHVGEVKGADGKRHPWLGAPNQRLDLARLMAELSEAQPLSMPAGLHAYDLAYGPLGVGQSYAGFFGWLFANGRDPQTMEPVFRLPDPDAFVADNVMPWWWARGPGMYTNGIFRRDLPVNHLSLAIQYLTTGNGGEFLRSDAFKQGMEEVQALVWAVEPPPYPGPVDRPLAEEGRSLFDGLKLSVAGGKHACADCHDHGALAAVGTDSALAASMLGFSRMFAKLAWFDGYTWADLSRPGAGRPGAYTAPPLTGEWVRTTVFHNGSVPFDWVFSPRPPARTSDGGKNLVRLTDDGYEVVTVRKDEAYDPTRVIDRTRRGSDSGGHMHTQLAQYGGQLTEEQQGALIEYLKVRCEVHGSDPLHPTYGVAGPDGVCLP